MSAGELSHMHVLLVDVGRSTTGAGKLCPEPEDRNPYHGADGLDMIIIACGAAIKKGVS
jgi:hypothetical protein